MKIIACTHCGAKYKVDPERFKSPSPRIRCKKCEETFVADFSADDSAPTPAPAASTPPPPAPTSTSVSAATGANKVLFAHESEEIRTRIEEQLTDAGYEVVTAANGVSALVEIEKGDFAVAVLDVSLPKMFGFEVCEVVRRDPSLERTKLLLIAAIYHKDRYRRNPPYLYGADAYIEKHALEEEIIPSLQALISGTPQEEDGPAATEATDTPSPQESETAAAPAVHDDTPAPLERDDAPAPVPATAPAAPASDEIPEGIDKKALEKARRTGRVMVSDLALYNKEVFAVAKTPAEIYEKLHTDVEECKAQIQNKVPQNIQDFENVLEVAILAYIAKRDGT